MLGSTLARFLSTNGEYRVIGSSRSRKSIDFLNTNGNLDLIYGVDVSNFFQLKEIISDIVPNFVINCVGVIKQDPRINNPIKVIAINSLLPHQLSFLCDKNNARLIHISTDCVFSGIKGNYCELDFCDGDDLYARSKLLGEISTSTNVITFRTSIIGHELFSNSGLLEWFLSQQESVKGFSKAIFSGLTTLEVAKVISGFVLSNPDLNGLYHLSTQPIDKYSLLKMIAVIYDKKILIDKDDQLVINRSLDSSKFRIETGWTPPHGSK